MNAAPPDVPQALSHADIRLIIVGILLAMFLGALDQTIVATALPTIGRELGDAELLSWVVTSYLVTATAVTPLYGKLSDIVGRRPTMLVAVAVFIVGSIGCAVAPNMMVLILARAVQGMGGGGLISLAQTIIGDIVAPRERGRYQAYIAGMFVSSSLAGPVLGGMFAEHLHWSFIFWINVPLGLAAFGMTWTLLKRLPVFQRPHRLDLLGAVLLVAATTALMVALNWGGNRYPWLSTPILSLVGSSALLWVLFGLRLGRASEPLIPLTLFANPVVRNGTLAACFGMGTFIGLSIYVPVFLEVVKGYSAADSGLALVPFMVGTVVGATSSGRAMTKVTHYRSVPVAGLSIASLVLIALALTADRAGLGALEAMLTVVSCGLGTLMPVTTVSIQNAVAPAQLGTATAGMNFFRSLGGALVVAVFGAVLLSGGVAGGLHGPAAGAPLPAAGGPVLEAFRWMFAAASLSVAVAILFLLRMDELPLRARSASAPPASPE